MTKTYQKKFNVARKLARSIATGRVSRLGLAGAAKARAWARAYGLARHEILARNVQGKRTMRQVACRAIRVA